MGGVTLGYGSNLSWSDDVSHAAVGGIGSYSYDALEPLQYLARGSFSLMRYSSKVRGKNDINPERAGPGPGDFSTDGNSMLRANSFNPSNLLISRAFDIEIYERRHKADERPSASKASAGSPTELFKIFTISNARLTSYSLTFTPGQLIAENIGFICIRVTDELTQV
jgi:hypothetical protein